MIHLGPVILVVISMGWANQSVEMQEFSNIDACVTAAIYIKDGAWPETKAFCLPKGAQYERINGRDVSGSKEKAIE